MASNLGRQKNSNISQAIWRVRGRERQSYTLGYDFLSRMTTSTFKGLSDANVVNNSGAYNENLQYDLRGNINTLQRTGKYKPTGQSCWSDGTIDQLTFTYYTGYNRLQKVADAAAAASKPYGWHNTKGALSTSSYLYDANGNLVSDPYKGMSVAYNFLNLPKQMLWSDAGGAEKIIDILYDAKGRKLRKTVTDNTTLLYRQDYAGSLEYRFTTSNGLQPEAVYFGDGRVAFIENYRRYEYYLKDHLGNIRLTFTDKNNNGVVDVNNTATNEILQENHYYPFGMDQSGPWMNDAALDNAYKYNGIERNTDFGMNLDLAFFRSYDAVIGRWWQVDPKPAYIHNPYMGMGNNPMINSDPLGDTLRGVDARSARRAQSIIQSSFGKGKASEATASLFTVGEDGKTFNQISRKEFRKATKGLTSSQKSLALGYYKAANSKTTHVVEAVKRNESISAYGKSHLIGDIKTGADIDRGDYGGFTYPGSADSSPGINNAVDGNATYSILVTDAQSIITGLKFPSSAGELLSHELLGHAMARSLGIHLDCLEAIRATNLFMYANPRVDGRTQLRRDHGVGEIGNGDPLSPPSYLKDMDGVSFPGN